MEITLQQTEKLFMEGNLNFNSLGFSLLVTRLKIMHARDPVEHTLQSCTDAINSFLARFQGAMARDFEIIKKL